MKIKELLLPLTLALLTTWALQYFWDSRHDVRPGETNSSGQKFEAPAAAYVHKPLDLEVNFLDAKPMRPTKLTEVETKNVRYVFSNDGACLQQVSFYRNWGGKESYLDTLPEHEQHTHAECTFLVALQGKTPYYFDLVEEKRDELVHVLKYKADFEEGVMYKTFSIYNDIHRIDLQVTLEPKTGQELHPRIFYASPYLSPGPVSDIYSPVDKSFQDTVKAVNNDERGAVQEQGITNVVGHYWSKPTLFGTMDRYFVFALIKDEKNLVQRGYYKPVEQQGLYSILEGPATKEAISWQLSFYFGPKIHKDMESVDTRLGGVMKYGILAPISKPISIVMLDILNFLYRYCGNYGLAIILITLLLKLIMLPFTIGGEEAMNKSRQQRAQFEKKLKYLQEKYKGDPQGLAQARADLVKKQGLPGFGGCLPILIQLPMFWGLSIVLSQSIELYKAPFLWIPDLSLPDPYYILPILMGIGVMLHNPTGDSKQRLTSIVVGIFLAVFGINFSAGLTLYICVSTLMTVLQSVVLKLWKKA